MANDLLNAALQQKILPAVTFLSAGEALDVAKAILKGGLRVLEITFRTEAAAEAITLIRKNLPEMYVGAGTLLSGIQIKKAVEAGAQFGLAPGLNPSVCNEAVKHNLPFIPGVMTPSEIERAAGMGFQILKLFPAAQLDGIGFLKALSEPYGHLQTQFIPMGGVSMHNMNEYLQLKNVIAVGGSWLVKGDFISEKKFDKITELVRGALSRIQ